VSEPRSKGLAICAWTGRAQLRRKVVRFLQFGGHESVAVACKLERGTIELPLAFESEKPRTARCIIARHKAPTSIRGITSWARRKRSRSSAIFFQVSDLSHIRLTCPRRIADPHAVRNDKRCQRKEMQLKLAVNANAAPQMSGDDARYRPPQRVGVPLQNRRSNESVRLRLRDHVHPALRFQ
jgi:hypothetical protein